MPFSLRFKHLMEGIVRDTPVPEITERTNVHRSTIYQWLKGNAPRDQSKLRDFAKRLSLSTEKTKELLEASIPPPRLYDFDDELDASAIGTHDGVADEQNRDPVSGTRPHPGSRANRLRSSDRPELSHWLGERDRALTALDELFALYFEGYRDYLDWCRQNDQEPRLPAWRPAIALALSHADTAVVREAITMSLAALRSPES